MHQSHYEQEKHDLNRGMPGSAPVGFSPVVAGMGSTGSGSGMAPYPSEAAAFIIPLDLNLERDRVSLLTFSHLLGVIALANSVNSAKDIVELNPSRVNI